MIKYIYDRLGGLDVGLCTCNPSTGDDEVGGL